MKSEVLSNIFFRKKCFEFREELINALENPREEEEKVFRHVLSVSKNTKYSSVVGIEGIHDIHGFKKNVPINEYDNIRPWLDEQAEVGNDKPVITNDHIVRWLKTSGTTGVAKKIPYTEQWIFRYRAPSLYAQWANYIRYCPGMLDHRFSTLDLSVSREYPTEFLNNIPYQSITNRPYPISQDDWCTPWHNEPWFVPDIPNDYSARTYYRLRHFLNKDLRAIVAINPSNLVALKNYLLEHLSELRYDIETGELKGEKVMDADPLAAKRLFDICSNPGFNFKEIWPNLELVVCWTNSTAQLYLPQIERLFPQVKILPFMSVGTEGVVTIPIDESLHEQPLAINQGFYEFVDVDVDLSDVVGKPLENTLSFHELVIGKSYYLIMSQANGVLRYLSNDIYQVTGYLKDVPLLRFSGRKGVYNSFTGEKLTEEQILSALTQTFSMFKMQDSLFYCCPVWASVPYYRFLVETDSPENCELGVSLSDNIDKILSIINQEYKDKRASGRLDAPDCKLIQTGVINDYYERVVKKKSAAYQVKYNPFALNENILNELLSFYENEYSKNSI